jgi:hypothetical protein
MELVSGMTKGIIREALNMTFVTFLAWLAPEPWA